ncbi:LysR family transcriptional regulator [Amphibacillus sp. Q70]|uniref:LysR family transcriptional regulator n=1 Tax=Amphibacillus sp. Q70 TaxID=3453416 RepID=UPI003F837773
MKVDDLRLLIAVKEHGTIRRAAEALFISQPAVSQRLQQIESYWGGPLFVRSARNVMLTPAGEEVLALASRYIAEEQQVKQRIDALKEQVSGTLSLGVSSVIGQYVMPGLLKEFMNNYPAVNVELTTGLSEDILPNNYHVKVTRGKLPSQRFSMKLFEDPLYYVAAKELTSKQPFIEHQSDNHYQPEINFWLKTRFQESILLPIKVDQIETCKQMVIYGVGRSVLPKTVIKNLDRKQFTIEPVVVDDKPLSRSTWLTVTDEAQTLPQVKVFIKLLQEAFNS